jgi:hypothetical protein
MLRRFLPAAIVAASLLALGAPDTRAAASYDSCTGFIDAVPTVIAQPGTWCLRKDVATSQATGAAILINTNNVTIDCNGHKLSGLGAGIGTKAYGVRNQPRINSTVRGCIVRGFVTGIALQDNVAGDGGHLVEDNRLEGNTHAGITVEGHGSIVRRNLVRDSGGGTDLATGYGIYTTGTSYVDDNTVLGVVPGSAAVGAYGIHTANNAGGTLRGNVVAQVDSGADDAAILAVDSARLWIDGNRLVGSDPEGSHGVVCTDATTRLSDNSVGGFAVGESGCSRPATDTNDIP